MKVCKWSPARPVTAFENSPRLRHGSVYPSMLKSLFSHSAGRSFTAQLALSFVLILTIAGVSSAASGKHTSSFPSKESVTSAATALLKAHKSTQLLHIIVQVQRASNSPVLTKERAARLFPGHIRRVMPAGGFVAMDVTPSQALALSHNSAVKHVSFDWGVTTTGLLSSLVGGLLGGRDSSTDSSISYETQRSDASVAWSNGLMGDGVGVAVVDSGIAPHPDIANRIVGWQDFVNGQPTPYDDYGHGTHVAGIVAGDGTASSQYSTHFVGVAPHANLIGVKVLDENGMGTTSTVIAGIDWCIQHAQQYNIRVINLSIGHAVYESYVTDPLCQEVEAAWNAGLVVVVAAGNYGRLHNNTSLFANNGGYGTNYGSISSPGNDPDAITVGAMKLGSNPSYRTQDAVASYSSRGPSLGDDILKPDIIAYGNLVTSLYDAQGTLDQQFSGNAVKPSQYGGSGSPEYFILSGTSMATPVVAGAAALMLEHTPNISPDTLKLRLMLSADKWGADAFSYGAGYLDIPAALSCQAVAVVPMVSPSLAVLPGGLVGIVTPANSEQGIWGNSALWGGRVMARGNALYGSSTVGGQSALWGGRAIYGSSTIWGDSATWGAGVTSGDGGSQGKSILGLGDLLGAILNLLL
ncbi:MAG TPA: S8 family peptidase [Capsulimonadaceae bacterium]|nr:S8 family peptidase [Capsulimonadaceae bacterium]